MIVVGRAGGAQGRSMCDQSFLERGQATAAPLRGSTAEIPDIFDVLAGGEDEGTVR